MRYFFAPAMAVALVTAGCAEITSIYRSAPLSGPDGKIVLIDAKQRVVATNRTEVGDITCAEPSPDALTVFAASLAGTFTVPDKASAQLAASLNETGANIGLRTPSIQLLRDVMYRICEGYSAKAIDGSTFATLHRRYQNVMIGLLAIEQLTGATRPAVVMIGGSARADVGDDVVQAQRNLDAAKLDEENKKDTLDEKKAALTAATEDVEKKKEALKTANAKTPKVEKDIEDAQGKLTTAEEEKTKAVEAHAKAEADLKQSTKNREAVELKLKAAVSGSSAASSSFGTPSNVQISTPPSDQAAKEVAKVVEAIVSGVVTADYSADTCQAIVLNKTYIESSEEGIRNTYKACLDLVIARANAKKADADTNAALNKTRGDAIRGNAEAIQRLQTIRGLGIQ